jgi:predicted ATPase/DNA-binding NarL/FixJ family response regulator
MVVHSLPTQATPFVGREDELAEIAALFANPACRLLTLIGPGGIGKTRLALQAAADQMRYFPHGVHFVPLQPLTSPDLLPSAIASALKVTLYGAEEPRLQIMNYLRDKQLLLILDNFEQLLEGTDLLTDILQACANVKILTTSRERLNMQEEWTLALEGLTFPGDRAAAGVEDYSAVQLFLQRARQVQSTFSLKENSEAVKAICQRAEGMPLGLELAATWLRVMTCQQIAAQMERSLEFLTTPLRNVPERHRSLRGVFEQSWKLLNDSERDVLMKLSVFRGGFDLEAAGEVAGATLTVLAGLADKSLVRVDAKGRYDLHDLLRQYAESKLNQDEQEIRRIRDVHAAYYVDFLHQRSQDIVGKRQRETFRDIAREMDNIRATWQHIIETADIPAIHQAAYTYYLFGDLWGYYQESTQTLEKAIARLKTLEPTRSRDLALATLEGFIGWSYIRLGQFDEARTAFQTSLSSFRNLGTRTEPGFGTDGWGGLGLLELTLGNYAEAIAFAEAARDDNQAAGDKLNLQTALYVLANANYSLGQYEAALRYSQQVYDLSEETGNAWFSAHILVVMGDIARGLEDYDRAWEYYQTCYALKQELDDRGSMASALNGMARVAWLRRDYQDARRLFQQGHDLYREVNDPGGIATSIFGLGDTAQVLGDYQTAQTYFQQALKIALDMRWSPLILGIVTGVSDLLLKTGDNEQAVTFVVLAAQHPASDPPTRRRATQLLARAKGLLPSSTFTAASARGVTADLETIARSLIEQLKLPREYPPAGGSRSTCQSLIEPLSERELEILRLLAQGLTNQDIAERLTLVVGTVKAHNHHIFNKLGVTSRTQAIARAREFNLL